MSTLRPDLRVIADLIAPDASVLDVGCGEGDLLAWLAQHKNVRGRGLELNHDCVNIAIAKGIAAVQGDIAEDLPFYPEQAYDYTVISLALQAMDNPPEVLRELGRIGKIVIVSVPNFGQWRNRWYLLCKGKMPVTSALSYQWYETPNIHFCTIFDFIELAKKMGFEVLQQAAIYPDGTDKKFAGKNAAANLLAEQGVFVLQPPTLNHR